jgi:hypothetical protein
MDNQKVSMNLGSHFDGWPFYIFLGVLKKLKKCEFYFILGGTQGRHFIREI